MGVSRSCSASRPINTSLACLKRGPGRRPNHPDSLESPKLDIHLTRAAGRENDSVQADDGSSWTPFSLPEAEPSTRPRVQRMVETRRGDLYVEEPTTSGGDAREGTVDAGQVSSIDACAGKGGEGCCSHCQGTGLQQCTYCQGLGRTNFKDRVMLPKGVFPTWCTRCIRCSGTTICAWCLGSGRAREPIGFRV